MSKKTPTHIDPPAELIRVKVETNWRYGKRAKFWEIEIFDQELSNKYNEVYYSRACRGGLAYTKIGLRWTVRRKLKKLKVGYSTKYYTPDIKKELV